MAKFFSKEVDRYFKAWIQLDTWDSLHSFDMSRFYSFIKALKRYSRKYWITNFRENIVLAVNQYHPGLQDKHVQDMADYFYGQAETIFAYEAAEFLKMS